MSYHIPFATTRPHPPTHAHRHTHPRTNIYLPTERNKPKSLAHSSYFTKESRSTSNEGLSCTTQTHKHARTHTQTLSLILVTSKRLSWLSRPMQLTEHWPTQVFYSCWHTHKVRHPTARCPPNSTYISVRIELVHNATSSSNSHYASQRHSTIQCFSSKSAVSSQHRIYITMN